MEDQYTFKLDKNVVRNRVSFKNRFGIVLAGDLYLPAAGKPAFADGLPEPSQLTGKEP